MNTEKTNTSGTYKQKKQPYRKRQNKDFNQQAKNAPHSDAAQKPKSNIITIRVNHEKKNTYNAEHPYAVDCTWADLSSDSESLSPSPSPTPSNVEGPPPRDSTFTEYLNAKLNSDSCSRPHDYDPKTPAPIIKKEPYVPSDVFLGSFHPNMNLIISPFNFSCPPRDSQVIDK